jgi:membrane protein implicated in regulation of membrane protease activity
MNAYMLWMILAAAFLVLEVSATPGIGMLFAAFGAFSLGTLLAFGILNDLSIFGQTAWFLSLTAVWALILWYPLKHWMQSKSKPYENFSGTTAIVGEGGLVKGTTGTARWSGAIMKARIAPDARIEFVVAGEEVLVNSTDGNVLLVDSKPPQQAKDS